MKIIATYSPCCGILRSGVIELDAMHCALPHEHTTLKLVDAAELAAAEKRIAELEDELSECEFCEEPIAGQTVKPFVCVKCWNAAIRELKAENERLKRMLYEAEVLGKRHGGEPEVLPKPESFNGTLEQWVVQRNAILRRAMDAMGVLKEEKTP